jgi:hypothetical protein
LEKENLKKSPIFLRTGPHFRGHIILMKRNLHYHILFQ